MNRNMNKSATKLALVLAFAGFVASGCSSVTGDNAFAANRAAEATESATLAGTAANWTTTTSRHAPAHNENMDLVLTNIRAAKHDGYDRVVFDFAGTGTPGWEVKYVEKPIQDGSGFTLKVAGDKYLTVQLKGMGLPYESNAHEFSTSKHVKLNSNAVTEAVYSGYFEGESVGFIGVKGVEKPFRVTALTNPTRIVVDVAHQAG